MDSDLSLEFLRVVEQAAIACAHTMGQGDRHKSDQVAVEAMRQVMDTVPIDGTIVIGEGERDEAPMLYIGEKVGMAQATGIKSLGPIGLSEVDIAVDPLEGTNLCATGAPNAIAVLAASERAAGDAVQIHGANGYSDEYPVGRFFRNCKGAVIYEGTREIHTLMQADYLLGYREDRPLRCELPPYRRS